MNYNRHGLSVGIERAGKRVFLTLKVKGKLSHHDYETITPMIDSALAEIKDSKIHALIDGTEFEGWEARAAWDDFKLGLKHGREFEKIAIYGHKQWQEVLARVGRWFVSGDIRYFENEDDAVEWLSE